MENAWHKIRDKRFVKDRDMYDIQKQFDFAGVSVRTICGPIFNLSILVLAVWLFLFRVA